MSSTHHGSPASGAIEIDAGVRAWYASCRCCLSDANPEAVAILDAERDAAGAERAATTILDPVCDPPSARSRLRSGDPEPQRVDSSMTSSAPDLQRARNRATTVGSGAFG